MSVESLQSTRKRHQCLALIVVTPCSPDNAKKKEVECNINKRILVLNVIIRLSLFFVVSTDYINTNLIHFHCSLVIV